MKRYLPLLLSTLCFSEDINKLYEEAQNLENQGNYKEAMLLYKKAADLNIAVANIVIDQRAAPTAALFNGYPTDNGFLVSKLL